MKYAGYHTIDPDIWISNGGGNGLTVTLGRRLAVCTSRGRQLRVRKLLQDLMTSTQELPPYVARSSALLDDLPDPLDLPVPEMQLPAGFDAAIEALRGATGANIFLDRYAVQAMYSFDLDRTPLPPRFLPASTLGQTLKLVGDTLKSLDPRRDNTVPGLGISLRENVVELAGATVGAYTGPVVVHFYRVAIDPAAPGAEQLVHELEETIRAADNTGNDSMLAASSVTAWLGWVVVRAPRQAQRAVAKYLAFYRVPTTQP